MFLSNSLAFSMIQQVLTIWFLVPLPFLNLVCTLKFSAHILLKTSLQDFEHYFASIWNEHNCMAVWNFFVWHCPPLGLDWKLTLFFFSFSNWALGFLGGTSGKEPICQCRRLKRCRSNPWVGKIPLRGAQQLTSVFLPGKFHGQRSLAGYSSWLRKESDMTEAT